MKKIIALLIIFSIIGSACVSKKHKGDLSKLGKAYHNTTAHYNGYFNAEELLVKNKEVLENQEKDNFNEILPVFAYSNATNRKAVAPDMDIAIKKVSVVISKHPYSDWVDDSYLLFAKAQYYKGDYEGAEETLQFLIKNYDPSKPKKGSKKKKSKKKKKKKSKKKKSKKKKSSKKKKKKKKKSKKKKWVKKSDIKKNEAAKKEKEAKEKLAKEKEAAAQKAKTADEAQKAALKKLKKEAKENKGDSGNYILKHRPCFQEAKLWLAKVKIERDGFTAADFTLKQLERDPNTFEYIKRQIPVIQADLNLRQKKYKATIESLDKAISRTKKRKPRARYYFIKGQINDKLGQTAEASLAYKMAIKMKPAYDMTFRAQLNNILNERASGVLTAEAADKRLLKMTKDFKNYEYRDQIYYILAKNALQSENDSTAIAYLKESLAYNIDNKSQKTESYFLLAELYYNNSAFVNSKNYYDSTLTVMNEADLRYMKVERTAENLKDIARYLTTIKEETKWLAIGKMSKKEQEKIAREILEQQRADELKKNGLVEVTNNPKSLKSGTLPRAVLNGSGKKGLPSFFAYNPSDIQNGKRSFKKKWGDRPLVDNWRRQAAITEFNLTENDDFADNGSNFEFTESELAKVLEKVPSTPEALKKSNTNIKDAYFYLGALFRDKLSRNDNCVFYEEKLNALYPQNDKELDSWYYLYLAHTDLKNTTTAKTYKDKILAKYPESTYGRVLADPNFKGDKNKEEKLNAYYKVTYDNFSNAKYAEALDQIKKVDDLFGAVNPLGGKFALLNAMCLGNLKGKKEYIAALNKVIAQYPESAEEKRAKEIKRLLNGKTGKNATNGGNNTKSLFKFNESKTHYCVVSFQEKIKSFNDAKIAISDYNRNYEKLLKLRIANLYLGSDKKASLIVIRKFKNRKKAQEYLDGVNKNLDEFLPTELKFKVYIMSQDNYRIVLRNKSIEGYDEFYSEFYK